MAWFALDDGFDTHPKVRKAGNAAVGLFVRLGVHATRHLTEGHLDGAIVRTYGTEPNVRRLIAVGMLHGAGHTCSRCPQPADGGYYIHDYLDYNKSRAQIEAARENARKRQQKGRDTARSNRNQRGIGSESNSNRSRNEADSAPNRSRNDPLFDDSAAGQGGPSRRDTHEGVTGVPSPPLPSHNYDVADVDEESAGSRASVSRPDGRLPLDQADFHITDTMRRWALQTFGPGLDIEYETQQFVSHYRADGSRRRSWPDEWQKWIRRSAKFASERRQQHPTSNVIALPSGQTLTGTDAKVAGWMAIAEQLRQQGDPA
ncbi:MULTISPECIES: hypothetical protein [unclassified Streptomyces]|uniref:hypothetical protein n=1 Tax=unclassified Streptomyces TaxID=2593676 RepID=UPI00081D3CC2|nr:MULTISPECIES: hypothetical protein [unclassified Streptomyces]MYZ37496.1 hypothetical protein [Streptomyces sp. SID4917]SCF91781.1 hypothetical protein GA0115259_104822 [Streptomyces sp. MnatMP-M17]